ncbi:hypothetical protein [Allomuricauda sp. M10]|uniref:hypothetical protein n=1 Tax=Allomuricauda sp. M10 TaxID=2683292 RepID=UPI001D182140|nr:hypothetical protein [Muricauda sp. M10]
MGVKLSKRDQKILEYQSKILGQIDDIFNNPESENYVGLEELSEGENMTFFLHAMANCAPNLIYQNFTGESTDNLGFNHLANRLCVQYAIKEGDGN